MKHMRAFFLKLSLYTDYPVLSLLLKDYFKNVMLMVAVICGYIHFTEWLWVPCQYVKCSEGQWLFSAEWFEFQNFWRHFFFSWRVNRTDTGLLSLIKHAYSVRPNQKLSSVRRGCFLFWIEVWELKEIF